MAGHKTWRELRRERAESPAYQAGYERARRRYELGKKVRELREVRGMSQSELAQRMGTTQSVVARLELGGVEPRFDTLDRVAAALDSTLVVDIRPNEAAQTLP
jgi:ribosome-binding protein aMBF1 (putative translation factor)